MKFALSFSIQNDIVGSSAWANLKNEDGVSGGAGPRSAETKDKIRKSTLGKTYSESTKAKLSMAHTGKILSEAHKEKLSKAHTGKTQSRETIEKRIISNTGMRRSDECKANIRRAKVGRIYINDGVRNRILFLNSVECQSLLNSGWVIGKLW